MFALANDPEASLLKRLNGLEMAHPCELAHALNGDFHLPNAGFRSHLIACSQVVRNRGANVFESRLFRITLRPTSW
jgi:hypothetical protein